MGPNDKAKGDWAEWLRHLRGRTGLTQEQFAARLGVTFPTINRWENRRATPSPLALHQIHLLARQLGVGLPVALEPEGHPVTARLDDP